MVSRDDKVIRYWLDAVSAAILPLERRWTRHALKRVDEDLAQRVAEQRALFDRATVTGEADEVEMHGAAMCRGYAVALKAMEASGEADDAYLIGACPRTGYRIAIGHQKAAADRLAELHGQTVVWVSADEIASIMAGFEGFKQIAAVKQFFPGAEVVDIRPGDPAKAESGIAA